MLDLDDVAIDAHQCWTALCNTGARWHLIHLSPGVMSISSASNLQRGATVFRHGYSRYTWAAWFSVHATLAAETMIVVFSEFRK